MSFGGAKQQMDLLALTAPKLAISLEVWDDVGTTMQSRDHFLHGLLPCIH